MDALTLLLADIVTPDKALTSGDIYLLATVLTIVQVAVKFGDRLWKKREDGVQSVQCGADHAGIKVELSAMTNVLREISTTQLLMQQEIKMSLDSMKQDIRDKLTSK